MGGPLPSHPLDVHGASTSRPRGADSVLNRDHAVAHRQLNRDPAVAHPRLNKDPDAASVQRNRDPVSIQAKCWSDR